MLQQWRESAFLESVAAVAASVAGITDDDVNNRVFPIFLSRLNGDYGGVVGRGRKSAKSPTLPNSNSHKNNTVAVGCFSGASLAFTKHFLEILARYRLGNAWKYLYPWLAGTVELSAESVVVSLGGGGDGDDDGGDRGGGGRVGVTLLDFSPRRPSDLSQCPVPCEIWSPLFILSLFHDKSDRD